MSTLLIRFQAPMQSWGVSSHFANRDTCREPTKSGTIGVLCAALGRNRDADITDLASLQMGVRIDREGLLQRDYHIVQQVMSKDGSKGKESEITNRYFLADAVFLVGLDGSDELLTEIQNALAHPKWMLYLGRKAFTPALPVWLKDGLKSEGLLPSLSTFPGLVSPATDQFRIVIEDPKGEQVRQDVPVSFADRTFSTRRIKTLFVTTPDTVLEEI